MSWIHKNSFTLLLLAAVALAFIFPDGGRTGGYFRSELTTRLGVVLIFLMQGLSLPTRALTAGLLNWRLHAFVQGWNFLLAPALLWLLLLLVRPLLEPAAWGGFWYLAILPTTVSSAVALTSVAKGDTAGAIFNTTLSNVLGVFLVPLWVVAIFALGTGAGGADLPGLLWGLTKLILLPLIAGQILRPFVIGTKAFARVKPWFKPVSNWIIIYIVYATFCNSVADDTWSAFGVWLVVKIVVLTALFLALTAAAVWFSSRVLGDYLPARVAGFFCGSQKTLAAGVPMANALFAGAIADGAQLDLSLLILPLMCYHPMQLLLAGFLVGPLQRRVEAQGTAPAES